MVQVPNMMRKELQITKYIVMVPPYTYSNHCYWDAVLFCPLKVMACGHVYVCDTPVFIGCQIGLQSVGLKINKYIHK